MAQLVEQFTRNEQVAGSNPAISSITKATSNEVAFVITLMQGDELTVR